METRNLMKAISSAFLMAIAALTVGCSNNDDPSVGDDTVSAADLQYVWGNKAEKWDGKEGTMPKWLPDSCSFKAISGINNMDSQSMDGSWKDALEKMPWPEGCLFMFESNYNGAHFFVDAYKFMHDNRLYVAIDLKVCCSYWSWSDGKPLDDNYLNGDFPSYRRYYTADGRRIAGERVEMDFLRQNEKFWTSTYEHHPDKCQLSEKVEVADNVKQKAQELIDQEIALCLENGTELLIVEIAKLFTDKDIYNTAVLMVEYKDGFIARKYLLDQDANVISTDFNFLDLVDQSLQHSMYLATPLYYF